MKKSGTNNCNCCNKYSYAAKQGILYTWKNLLNLHPWDDLLRVSINDDDVFRDETSLVLNLHNICTSPQWCRQARSQVLRFGGAKYIFRGARFLFSSFFFLGTRKFGGYKINFGGHCPRMPPHGYGPGCRRRGCTGCKRIPKSFDSVSLVVFCNSKECIVCLHNSTFLQQLQLLVPDFFILQGNAS